MWSIVKQLKSLLTTGFTARSYKMAIVVRTDLHMSKGKVAAQCAHAALECYRQASTNEKDKELMSSWLLVGQPKIVLRVDSKNELLDLAQNARLAGLITAVIRDAGKTQLEPGTISVLGIGPAPKPMVDQITSHLKLL